jgi:hypothetical protein
VLESLKKLFARKPRGTDVEYERLARDEPAAVPANPPTSGIPPAVPVDRPADESEST